jgi:hypothetical protein
MRPSYLAHQRHLREGLQLLVGYVVKLAEILILGEAVPCGMSLKHRSAAPIRS